MAKKDDVVDIANMEPAIFEMLLHFVYTDSLPAIFNGAGNDSTAAAQHLLVAADRYGMSYGSARGVGGEDGGPSLPIAAAAHGKKAKGRGEHWLACEGRGHGAGIVRGAKRHGRQRRASPRATRKAATGFTTGDTTIPSTHSF
ncbi:hypothetical protein HU200_013318 [Digitaria exilis]|uniref:BTB domain-containing protein n=1 Tax=Digitaria exilis TaxID=1010633 RepID=A0A835KNY1_9POAL|nr:hypothetical protein HU200_013318 [Digitaria exilis]